MKVHQDFKELLKLFENIQVEYTIVGGYALAFHGAPRFTGDLDLLISTNKPNGERVLRALHQYGFADSNLQAKHFETAKNLIRLGHPPVRVDILTSISGVTWNEVKDGAVVGRVNGLQVTFIGRRELIKNKSSTGRDQDRVDVETLQRLQS